MKSISNVLRAYRLLPLALVFVGVSPLGRKDRAAKRMTKQHQEYAKEGWTVANVVVYTENGDLEGFFVTYVKH